MLTYFVYPYYLFPSGGFQPSVAVLIFGFAVMLFTSFKKVIISGSMRMLIVYSVYAMLINIYWFFNTGDDSLLLYTIIALFGCFMFIALGNIFHQFTRQDARMFLFVVFATVATQALLLTFGIVKDVGGGRQVIWFNNPNQLGYFCLLSATIAVLVGYFYKIQNFLIPLTVALGIYISTFTLSRAALAGLVLFVPILLFFSTSISLSKKMVIVVMLALGGAYVADLYVNSEQYAALERRVERSQESSTGQEEVRHFDRVWEYPDYLVFGAGKGAYERFSENDAKVQEIHNLFLSVLFCYGIIGFLMYMTFLFSIIRNIQLMIYLLPVFLYNMTHNGGRVIALWFMLALIASSIARQQSLKNKTRRRSRAKTPHRPPLRR